MDALGLVELRSVARGYRTLDALVKESPVAVLEANLVEPGKFLILTRGGVAEIQAAHRVAIEIAGEDRLDDLVLPYAHPALWTGFAGAEHRADIDTIGIVEGASIAGVLASCDAALKGADVTLCGLRLATALGGKGYFVMTGTQDAVDAAMLASIEPLTTRSVRVREERIARPHPEFLAWLLRPAPFHLRGA